jgi:soluble lytic murein transglycosylase-like protein
MLWRPPSLSGALRVVAVGLGGAAVAMLLQHGGTERISQPPAETAMMAASAEAPAVPMPRAWLVRAGGWYIRVDGAEISIPSLSEQIASRPRSSLAVSISPFDHLIVHHAKAEGFDWRLIAALIFEESRFDPTSQSDKGAYGLMQVRPIAAEAVGAERFKAPDDNVKTGVRYLRHLDRMFRDAQGRDRLSLVLAAYNIGPGHVRDAQTLAQRFGYDPNRWEDAMDLMLPLLEQPSIYKHLPNGFAKGRDTVAYVRRTLDRYHRYQRETAGAPGVEADALSSSDPVAANG